MVIRVGGSHRDHEEVNYLCLIDLHPCSNIQQEREGIFQGGKSGSGMGPPIYQPNPATGGGIGPNNPQ